MGGDLSRRDFLTSGLGTVAALGLGARCAAAPSDVEGETTLAHERDTALCLNEDDSHFFSSRAGRRLTVEDVDGWVDQYADTQVRELMLCPNCMRTSYASEVWDPIWRGYDPDGPDDQPLLASTPPEARRGARGWIHTAWQLHQDGIDPYARWIARARQRGLSPWLSVRMNDVHNVDDEQSYIHSEFWRQHPEYRRVPYRFAEWQDRAFDYGHPEVREYHLMLIRELAERYDPDGFELDWMRFGYHFRPGHEGEGAELLTAFTAEVRALLDAAQQRRGHAIRLGARVPSRPDTALALGMDAVRWARQGLLDMLVVTPFWASIEPDMPIEVWRGLLEGTKVVLAAGIELLLRPSPDYANPPTNTLETVRGAAATLLDRGADRVYLFNYMDSATTASDVENYRTMLTECGRLETLVGKPRRHVLTYSDTWAVGAPRAYALPRSTQPGRWLAFRIPIGPRPEGAQTTVRLGMDGASPEEAAGWRVRLNGSLCAPVGVVTPSGAKPTVPLYAYSAPLDAPQRGHNVIEIEPATARQVVWVELAVGFP